MYFARPNCLSSCSVGCSHRKEYSFVGVGSYLEGEVGGGGFPVWWDLISRDMMLYLLVGLRSFVFFFFFFGSALDLETRGQGDRGKDNDFMNEETG